MELGFVDNDIHDLGALGIFNSRVEYVGFLGRIKGFNSKFGLIDPLMSVHSF